MVTIDGTYIILTRGDTATLNFDITINNIAYTPQAGDKLVFSIKNSYYDTSYVLQKNLVGTSLILSHADTQSLPISTYVYDMQITLADGQVMTYGPGKIKLLPDVTTD